MKPHPETQTARAEEVPWAEKNPGRKVSKNFPDGAGGGLEWHGAT